MDEMKACAAAALSREKSIKLSYDNIFFASARSDLVSSLRPPLTPGGASTREGFALANYPLIKPHMMKIYLSRDQQDSRPFARNLSSRA